MGVNRGIEHRTPDTVLDSFSYYDKVKWNICVGNDQVMCYEESDPDASRQLLETSLNAIANSGTTATYMLRVFDNSCTNLTAKTPPKGSQTFMFGGAPTMKTENGITIIDRTATNNQYAASMARPDPTLISRLEKLEKDNQDLLEKLHKSELANLKQDFTNQIAGLQLDKSEEKPDLTDRIFGFIEKKPDSIKDVFEGLGNLLERLMPGSGKNFIQPRDPAPAINGTTKEQTMDSRHNLEEELDEERDEETESDIPLTAEGALINPFLTPEEQNLRSNRQGEIIKARLAGLTTDQLDEVQMTALEVLEDRITPQVLTQMLLQVACMDNRDLNKLLSHLD